MKFLKLIKTDTYDFFSRFIKVGMARALCTRRMGKKVDDMKKMTALKAVTLELKKALSSEISDMEILELAHMLVFQPEPAGPKTVMHGGRLPVEELPVCEVIELYSWSLVSEEWDGEDAYTANQPIEQLIDWQLMAA